MKKINDPDPNALAGTHHLDWNPCGCCMHMDVDLSTELRTAWLPFDARTSWFVPAQRGAYLFFLFLRDDAKTFHPTFSEVFVA
jgi:hypothetical protein